jgi:spore coat polysaccharide biosynthesis protein SpsF (cytidylyltransferase family)
VFVVVVVVVVVILSVRESEDGIAQAVQRLGYGLKQGAEENILT